MTRIITRLLCLALLLLSAPSAHAWDRPEMAQYGTAYRGPEHLQVYVAHTKADSHAVIKIRGINHPLDGHVFWTKVAYSNSPQSKMLPNRITYTDESVQEERLRSVLFIEDTSGILYLPNYRGQGRVEIPIRYDKDTALETFPQHLATDYERQIGKAK